MKTIAEVMSRDVTTIDPQADLQHAAPLMRAIGAGALPGHGLAGQPGNAINSRCNAGPRGATH